MSKTLEFRRFRKKEVAPDAFKNHTVLFNELVDWVIDQEIPGDFTFDSYFTNAEILNHIHAYSRGYVGDLKFNRKIWSQGWEMAASQWATQIEASLRKPVYIGDKKQWYFTKTLHIPQVDHRLRLVILWDRKNGQKPAKILVTNRRRVAFE